LDSLKKLQDRLPGLLEWIHDTLQKHKANEVVVSTLGFRRLGKHFPKVILDQAKVVVVPEIPIPPLRDLGLPEFSDFENMNLDGITYKDTYFIQGSNQSEGLHFHELVHVVQWRRLGENNFLLAYGAGLYQFGYKNSPLERMASDLQSEFETDSLRSGLVDIIHSRTDAVWGEVAQISGGLE